MKAIGVVLALCALAGCGSYHTMEELEQQAFLSGDWSQVEYRESKISNRGQGSYVACPSGLMLYCVDLGSDRRCSCESSDDLWETADSWE